ncbi:MAG: hypothetical protein ACYT04_80630, partial [Nostoc sp.]
KQVEGIKSKILGSISFTNSASVWFYASNSNTSVAFSVAKYVKVQRVTSSNCIPAFPSQSYNC